MKGAVLADTGPLYAAVDPDDQHHARAQQELAKLEQERVSILLAYPILSEAYTLVRYRLGARVAHTWLQDTTAGTPLVNPTPDDYGVAISTAATYPDQAITLFDATLAALGTRLKQPVWTYDFHFDVMRVAIWR
jgi:predicted nucleic acid-binding protein